MCAASPTHTGNVAGIVFGRGEATDPDCGDAAAVDLSNGKSVLHFAATEGVIVAGEVAVAAYDGTIYTTAPDGGYVLAIDIASEEIAWEIEVPEPDRCSFGDLVVEQDGTMLAVVECVLGGPETLMELDPATGEALWSTEVPIFSPVHPAKIVNVSPHVLYVPMDIYAGELRVFDDQGTLRHTIASNQGGDPLVLAPQATDIDNERRNFPGTVAGGILVAVTDPGPDAMAGAGEPTQVVGIDLTTGEQICATELATAPFFVVQSLDGSGTPMLAGFDSQTGQGQLATVDPEDGTIAPGDSLSAPKDERALLDETRFVSIGTTLLRLRFSVLGVGPLLMAYTGG